MTLMETGLLVLVFVASTALALWLAQLADGTASSKRAKRLARGDAPAQETSLHWVERLAQGTQRLARLSAPRDSGEKSALRRRLINAGMRSPVAPTAYFGAKTLLALALPLLAMGLLQLGSSTLQGQGLLFVLLILAALGYYVPNLVVSRLVFLRQRDIFESFPDALDLMTVCVEAGLGIESALQRVAEDMTHRSRVLSDELLLVGLEMRAGAPRERALHNLALRTGVEDVEGFVSMLIQAERFGTSIAQALRVQAEVLRTQRRQRAEEKAARVAVQLVFPLILCIFPAILLVVMGPAALRIMATLPGLTGGQP